MLAGSWMGKRERVLAAVALAVLVAVLVAVVKVQLPSASSTSSSVVVKIQSALATATSAANLPAPPVADAVLGGPVAAFDAFYGAPASVTTDAQGFTTDTYNAHVEGEDIQLEARAHDAHDGKRVIALILRPARPGVLWNAVTIARLSSRFEPVDSMLRVDKSAGALRVYISLSLGSAMTLVTGQQDMMGVFGEYTVACNSTSCTFLATGP
jgi:hypothetical protein